MDVVWSLPLSRLTAADVAVAGGKGANLGELITAGFAVPSGFVVTTDAYRRAVADLTVPDRDGVLTVDVPPAVRDAVVVAYADLGGGPVAVRSSATAEDLPGAAFAGQQDTFLSVVGDAARLGIDTASLAIAVVVQRMVHADHAGVLLAANPVTGAWAQVVIDSNPGLGEAVVAGLVTPDHAVLDVDGRVV